jgi:hypothetical protein
MVQVADMMVVDRVSAGVVGDMVRMMPYVATVWSVVGAAVPTAMTRVVAAMTVSAVMPTAVMSAAMVVPAPMSAACRRRPRSDANGAQNTDL